MPLVMVPWASQGPTGLGAEIEGEDVHDDPVASKTLPARTSSWVLASRRAPRHSASIRSIVSQMVIRASAESGNNIMRWRAQAMIAWFMVV